MDQKTALKVLLEHSNFFSESSKTQILSQLDHLRDEEIKTLGKFLVLEKKKSLENAKQLKTAVESVLST